MINFISRKHFGYKLDEIGEFMNINSQSGVATSIIRFQKRLYVDDTLKEICHALINELKHMQMDE